MWMVSDLKDGFVTDQKGGVCVKGNRLLSIVKVLQNDSVSINYEDNKVIIENGKSKFQILECKNIDNYPFLPDFNECISEIEVENTDLDRIINETIFSIGSHERTGINGVKFEYIKDNNKFRMVSTDGTRMSLSECDFSGEVSSEFENVFRDSLFPQAALVEVKKLCSDSDSPWIISFGERKTFFQKEDTKIIVDMMASSFPEYRGLIDSLNLQHKLIVDRSEFIDTCKRVGVFVDRTHKSVKMSPKSKFFNLSSKHPDFGSVKESIKYDYSGETKKVVFNFDVSFNFYFLQDILKALKEDSIELNLGEDNKSAILVTTPDRTDCKFIIMPMSV
jgi:DNA polymerase-3 subunit beta